MRCGFRCLPLHFRAGQKRNSKLLFPFRQHPRFYFAVPAASQTSFFATRFSTGIRCEGGASYCLVSGRQPPSNFYFRSVGDRSNQLLRSPFFNRRPLRRGRILLIDFRGSTPVENFFSRCICARRTALRVSLISWPPRDFARAKPRRTTKFFSCAPRCLAHTTASKSVKRGLSWDGARSPRARTSACLLGTAAPGLA